jgi:hypothetical protein
MITRAEMEADLILTQGDVSRLGAIVLNLQSFIQNSGGEDRNYLKVDLMRYEAMLDEASSLELKIKHRLLESPK